MSDRQATQPKKKRSGSEKRQRDCVIRFRAKPDERVEMQAAAVAAGLSLSSYIRSLALAAPRTRAVRQAPPPELEPVKQILALTGRIGGNLYQLVRGMNLGEIIRVDELYDAAKEARDFVAEAREAFGLLKKP